MACILNEELTRLRADKTFTGWLDKLKTAYPDKSDQDIEDILVSFMEVNNGNFPGYTPSGVKSIVFGQLLDVYDGDEVMAMQMYGFLFSDEFIEQFGDWCGRGFDTEGLTEEQINKMNEDNQVKLLKSIRNPLGEPAVLFVNSVNHQSANSASAATTKNDVNLPFKIVIEDGEARIYKYDRSVQSGSITFAVAKNVTNSYSNTEEIQIDVDDIEKMYDFNSDNKGFTEKRLAAFVTQSTKDVYFISKKISKINGLLKFSRDEIHNKQEAIDFIKNCKYSAGLVFDTDPDSPFGCIQVSELPFKKGSIWQIVSPQGIFSSHDRFAVDGVNMTDATQTYVDRLAHLFFINADKYKSIKDYIIRNVNVVKPVSYLSSPMVDYDVDRFVLKPASNRTQHNIKTEFGLAYAVYMYKNKPEKFKKYLNWAKQFSDIRENSVGLEEIKNVNMVGNLIGSLLSGQLIDSNFYTAHSFDQDAIDQSIFVSKHHREICKIIDDLWRDVSDDIQTARMDFLRLALGKLSQRYQEIDFSDITDNISKNRTISKLNESDISHSFCDSIDEAKAVYGYRRTDSGQKKMYDATEYTRISAAYEQLNVLNKQIKAYLINSGDTEETISGDSLEKLISQYFVCIDTIVSIMDDDISKVEDFIWNTTEEFMYTPEYYQQLLYLDRSVIRMYIKQKEIIEKLFTIDSSDSDLIQKSLYDIFSQQQVVRFEKLRSRYYNNYSKLSNFKTKHDKKASLQSIIGNMIDDAIQHITDEWCNKNLKCLSQKEEQEYREYIKLSLEGHIDAGMPLDTFIGGAASSGYNIINILYRIIQTQGNRSNLLIKKKGDLLKKKFKSVFDNHNPFNQCKQFCEMIDGKTTGYFIRIVNYGQYYRAKVAEQRRLLGLLPKNAKGQPLYFAIDEDKSTATKLVIEWGVGSESYQNQFLDDMDRWIEKNANRRYNAQYYIDRRRILGKERNGIVVGNEAANRQNTLRRQIDGIKNRYRDKDTGVFLPSKVPPVQKKILTNLEQQLADLSSPYERYIDFDGTSKIRQKTGLDLAIALNIQEWNKFIQDKRSYSQDVERYNEIEQKFKNRIGKDLTQRDYDEFVQYYHKLSAKQEYYDALEKMYGKTPYGEYQSAIEDIRFKRRSILSRVRYGKKGLLQPTDLDALTPAEWEELKKLDLAEEKIKSKLPPRFNSESITSSTPVRNEKTKKSFIEEHREANTVHEYMGNDGRMHPLSVYYRSHPADFDQLTEDVLIDQFSVEASEYMNDEFDPTNSSYEQPRAYEKGSKTKKLYKNDDYDKIASNEKLFDLYNTFLAIMQEANEMFGYAAISSNYKLPQIYERAASVYLGRGCGYMNSFYYDMKRSFLVDERDMDRSYTSDIHADNTTSGKLRKRFVEMLSDPEHISTDLVYSVMAYYMTACRYSDKQDVQAQCELINRKIQSLNDSHKSFKTQADNTVETFLFENTMNTDSTASAILERFMEHTTAMMLKWKLKSAVKAFLDGYRLLTNVLISNKWNMMGHFLDSTKKALAQTFTSVRSSIDILDYNLSEALMSLNDINIQSFADTNKTKFTRAYLRSGMMPTLTVIDHITTKSIMLAVYDSIRLYTSPNGSRQFLNIEEFVNIYKKDHPELSENAAEDAAERMFWGEDGSKVVTLYDAYQLGERDNNGKIVKGTENILSIKDEYAHMFSDDEKENDDRWAIIQTRVQGQLNEMAAAINGFKPEDTKSGEAFRKWYLKPIFQIRSFLVSNYNELFKHSDSLRHMVPNGKRNGNAYRPQEDTSKNSIVNAINKFWSSDNNIIRTLNKISSQREMYNVLTGTKDVGYYFGVMSAIRKTVENLIIYFGSIIKKEDPEFRRISNAEKASVINMCLVLMEAGMLYNTIIFIGGLLTCLLGQGSDPDDEDEWFLHWVLWFWYDVLASLFNDTLVSLPTWDTLVDIFKNIMAIVPAFEQFKQSVFHREEAMSYSNALFGDDEMFQDPEYGTNESPFNLIKSGKWKGDMYGKRYFYEAVQNAPWLITPMWSWPISVPVSKAMPSVPLANLKESFSAHAAKAKASYTVNNLSPIDYFSLGVPSRSGDSYEKFHTYDKKAFAAGLLNDLIGGLEGESEIIDLIRDATKSPISPIPNKSPVDKVEQMFPMGRKYD